MYIALVWPESVGPNKNIVKMLALYMHSFDNSNIKYSNVINNHDNHNNISDNIITNSNGYYMMFLTTMAIQMTLIQ